jgi:hypothetical protein
MVSGPFPVVTGESVGRGDASGDDRGCCDCRRSCCGSDRAGGAARGRAGPLYPRPAFQVFFIARVVELDVLVPNSEYLESRLFAVTDAGGLPGWMEHDQPLFDAAFDTARSRWFALFG